jgi:uroporphyrinogen decarboxylase
MNGRERFLAAMELRPVDRTPVWFMRQAGRYLPEYRALKETYSFRHMVQTPELATEVTLQPLQRFHQIDAAIVFSDILVIPEALGMPYEFRDGGGIQMEWAFSGLSDLDRLIVNGVEDRLGYVYDTLDLVGASLGGEKALLGFGGSPWTLATYMVEGGSSKDFQTIKSLAFGQPDLFEKLMERITDALILYLTKMSEHGVDAVQIFDSWGSACPGSLYEQWSLRWIRKIIDVLRDKVSIILFSKGMGSHLDALAATGVSVISLDSSMDLARVANQAERNYAVQGNLDPIALSLDPEVTARATRAVLAEGPYHGHIFNLGHGVLPSAKIESVQAMLETVDSLHFKDR